MCVSDCQGWWECCKGLLWGPNTIMYNLSRSDSLMLNMRKFLLMEWGQTTPIQDIINVCTHRYLIQKTRLQQTCPSSGTLRHASTTQIKGIVNFSRFNS